MIEQEAANMAMNMTMRMANDSVRLILDVAGQTTRWALRLTGKGAERVGAMLCAIAKEQHRTKGRIGLHAFSRLGNRQEVFSIPESQLKVWATHAKQYNILYAVIKDKTQDGVVDLFVRPEDAPRINRIVERYNISLTPQASVAMEPVLEEEKTGPVRDDLDAIIDEALGISNEKNPAEQESTVQEADASDSILQPHTRTPEEERLWAAGAVAFTVTEADAAAKVETLVPDMQQEPASTALPSQNLDRAFEEMFQNQVEDPTTALLNGTPSETPSVVNPIGANAQLEYSQISQQGNNWTYAEVNEKWPLSTPKSAFTEAQLIQIHACFAKGLSAQQVDRIANPALPPEYMESLRNVTRSSVKENIDRIRSSAQIGTDVGQKAKEALREIAAERGGR